MSLIIISSPPLCIGCLRWFISSSTTIPFNILTISMILIMIWNSKTGISSEWNGWRNFIPHLRSIYNVECLTNAFQFLTCSCCMKNWFKNYLLTFLKTWIISDFNGFELLRAFILMSVHIMSVQIRSDKVFVPSLILKTSIFWLGVL